MNRSDIVELVGQLPSATAVYEGPEHVFVAVSSAYRRMIGGRDPVGQPIASVLPELEPQGFIRILDRVLETCEPYTASGIPAEWDDNGDGMPEAHFVDLVYSPLRDVGGEAWGIVAQVTDVTGRRRAEEALRESEQRFRGTFEAAGIGVAIVDPDGRLSRANATLGEMLGYESPEALVGVRFMDLAHPEDREADNSLYDRLLAGEDDSYTIEKRYLRRDGRTIWGRLTVSLVRAEPGARPSCVARIEDVTERRHREKEREFLASAGEVLASSLDYDATLASVTRLAVREIAEWCAVDELAPDGSIRRIAVAHPDPAKVELAQRLAEQYPPDPDAVHGAARVLRTGEPELVESIPDELLVEAAVDEEHLALARSLDLGSYLCVPLVCRGRVLAALTFVQGRSGRRYGPHDLWLAEELARRAAIAIDNARLFHEAEEARDLAEETAAELEAQAEELQTQAAQLEEIQVELELSNAELQSANDRLVEHSSQAEEARAVLDAFIEASPAAVAFVDPELRYRRVNPALARIDGVDPRGVIGRPIREIVPALAPRLEPLYRRVLETGEAIRNLELSAPRSSDPGSTAYFLVNYFPVRVAGGPILGVGLVALDVTERRAAQERERVFAEVLEESRNEIYLFDAETLRFERVNRGARENLGYSMEELSTMTPLDLKPEFSAESFAELVLPLRSGEAEMMRFETVHRRKDGSLYSVDVHLQLSEAGERPRFVALIFDVTLRKQAERELIAAKEAAEEANLAKSHFLATMSHELRTPLNAMIGYSDLLMEGLPVPIPEPARKSVDRIGRSARHLLALIEEILTFARIEAGRERVDLAEVQISELVEEACALLEPLASQKGLDFTCAAPAIPAPMRTDPRKVRQILLNLLGNAVKFTDRGGIGFEVGSEVDSIVFRVEDTGVGIAAENLERIFEPFWQEERAIHARVEGTGLGLPVTKRLVELLGGTLEVESEPGRGTTCTVRLPRRSPG